AIRALRWWSVLAWLLSWLGASSRSIVSSVLLKGFLSRLKSWPSTMLAGRLKMPSLATIIMIAIGAFLGWSGTYGIQTTTHAIQLSRAVKAERDEGVRVCNARVDDIAR